MKYPWQQRERQENNCGPVPDKINESPVSHTNDSTVDNSPENGFDIFSLLCKSCGVL